ncbi:unnamed protein product, partial [Vitis vinifera]
MYLTPRGNRDTVLESTKFASNLNLTRVKLGCGRTPAGHSKDCGIQNTWGRGYIKREGVALIFRVKKSEATTERAIDNLRSPLFLQQCLIFSLFLPLSVAPRFSESLSVVGVFESRVIQNRDPGFFSPVCVKFLF